jgi:prepilin-type N-terminal cleavage/methylation domain-containing protein
MMRNSSTAARPGGFTLIEVVITLIVGGVLATIGAMIMSNAFRAYFLGREIANDDWQGRFALERMTRELRTVRSTGDLNIGVAGEIRFTDASGNAIVYRRNAATSELDRSQDNGATFLPLADNVSALTFSYLQNDGQTTTAIANAVYFITAHVTVASANVTTVYRATVKPTAF